MSANKLQEDSLGLGHSVIMGIAGTAPAFSISASMASLTGAVGVLAPASLLYCGLIMFGVGLSYLYLNRLETNAGASCAWVGRIFNRTLGFFAGWTLLVATVLFMVSATIPVGNATLLLLHPALVDNQLSVTLVSMGWLLVVSAVLIRGIAITGTIQVILTLLEMAILLPLIVLAIIRFGSAPIHPLSWPDFLLTSFDMKTFAAGAVIALYFYWGWDVTFNLNEETRDPSRAPGRGAMSAMALLIATFTSFSSVILLVMNDSQIAHAGTNIIFALADQLLPRPWSYLAVVAVMVSTIGNLETSMLQFTRTLFANSRDGAMHPRWASLHAAWRTPHLATFLVAGLGCALLLGSLLFDGIGAVLRTSINAIGTQVAFYYGLAGFACAWHFRVRSRKSITMYVMTVVWPSTSASLLWVVSGVAIVHFDWPTILVAVGGILLGVVPLLGNQGHGQ